MSVNVEENVVRLAGRCAAEDAEALLVALQDRPDRIVDVEAVQKLHLAVVQVLLALRPSLRGTPDSAFLAQHLHNLTQ